MPARFNGEVRYSPRDNSTSNQTVYVTCNEGYELDGTGRLSCLAGQMWNTSFPNCSLVSCGHPGQLSNGALRGENFTYRNEVVYSCADGYRLEGTARLTCMGNGSWSAARPRCTAADGTGGSSGASSSAAAIGGGVGAGVVVLFLIAVMAYYLKQKKGGRTRTMKVTPADDMAGTCQPHVKA